MCGYIGVSKPLMYLNILFASIRAFSEIDTDFGVSEFLHLCEDVMTNSYLTDPGDKNAFGRSRLQPAN